MCCLNRAFLRLRDGLGLRDCGRRYFCAGGANANAGTAQLVGLKAVSGLDDLQLVLVGNCLDVFGLEVNFGGMALDS